MRREERSNKENANYEIPKRFMRSFKEVRGKKKKKRKKKEEEEEENFHSVSFSLL